MITEDYISFEIAKLLKDKRFNEPCYAYWHEDENRLIISQSMYPIKNITNPCFFGPAAPTLQMAMKWLRDIHGLFIHIDVIREASCWLADIQDIKGDVSVYPVEKEFPNYEEACEAAIKYCLKNLI